MIRHPLLRCLLLALVSCAALWLSSCAVPLGPGYAIQKQRMNVRFEDSSAPAIRVEAEYQMKNTGNQPLAFLEMRLPGRRFHAANLTATWDGAAMVLQESPDNPRNSLLQFQKPWTMAARHILRLTFEVRRPPAEENGLAFTSEAFFLPQGGWSPELVPSKGLFGFGGVPPKKWDLFVAVPQDFRVHASGEKTKQSRERGQTSLRFAQAAEDLYPFVVAGRYADSQLSRGKRNIYLWTRSAPSAGSLAQAADILERQLSAFDAAFGVREKRPSPLWIVECPSAQSCIAGRSAPFARFLGEEAAAANAEILSFNTVLVDLSGDPSRIASIAAPSLAASWLGYGRNPAFREQDPPLSALPLFAAALGREAAEGPAVRSDMIRRALADIPADPQRARAQDAAILRAKSFLFFYALRDRYGAEAFRNAIQLMLAARQGRGFNLDDFIAAFEQETHQNIAEFVRLWMKHPGVPAEFRARYAPETAVNSAPEEKKP